MFVFLAHFDDKCKFCSVGDNRKKARYQGAERWWEFWGKASRYQRNWLLSCTVFGVY